MRNNMDRMLIGSFILLGIVLIGLVFFFVGEPVIELFLLAMKYVIYWVIWGTITVAFLFVAYISFSRSKNAKELFEALIKKNK
ncbi:MAG: hypothetical protein J6B87_01305 [Clostridia bacterium]|nr:hypothetical protein [Clostridia bacterium]